MQKHNKNWMRHFPAPAEQPKAMRENFIRDVFAIFRGALLRMKFFTKNPVISPPRRKKCQENINFSCLFPLPMI